MRDVNYGWMIRYLHANTASFFFLFVYLHIGRGLYYGSYKAPRALVWSIGVIILILMMAYFGPKCTDLDLLILQSSFLPFAAPRVRAIQRIGPHNKNILTLLICGMLGDWWCMRIKGKTHSSVRFYLEQGIVHSAYVKYCAKLLYDLGYSNSPEPVLVKKTGRSHLSEEEQFNYRVVTYTYTSLNFIYDSFYKTIDGKLVKVVPPFIGEYLTPFGLALWIMDDGSRQKGQGIMIATHSFSYQDVQFLANLLTELYGLKTSVVKSGIDNQWRINIWKESMPKLAEIVKPYMIPEMAYKLDGYL